jgi:hypothetical protein
VNAVAISPDGTRGLSGSDDGTASLWDLETGNRIFTWSENAAKAVKAVAFTIDGRYALSGGLDRTLTFWDLETGNRVRSIPAHKDLLNDMAVSPDGRHVLTTGGLADKQLALRDLETGALIRALNEPEAVLVKIAISPDGRYILSGGFGGALTLWDLESGKPIRRFPGHRGNVRAVAFSRGGRYLISGSADTTLFVWLPRTADARGGPAGRTDAERLDSALAAFREQDFFTWTAAREEVLRQGERAVEFLLKVFPPDTPSSEPAALDRLLKELDDDSFERREAARKKLSDLGDEIVPWIRQRLQEGNRLSAEVRQSLTILLNQQAHWRPIRFGDLGRVRAVLTLLEMPDGDVVRKALNRYSEGTPNDYATTLARRALNCVK